MDRRKEVVEKDFDAFIIRKTIGTTLVRLMEGDYRGYITTLRADPDNAGTIYIGKTNDKENVLYPLAKDDYQVTRMDLDKLFVYASQATQYLHIWAEPDVQRVKVGK